MKRGDSLSLPLGQEVLLLNNLEEVRSFLILYEPKVNVYHDLIASLRASRANDEFCFFAYDNSSGRLHPERVFGDDEGVHLLPLTWGTSRVIKDLNKAFREAYRKASEEFGGMRAITDFGGLMSQMHEEEVLDAVRRVHHRGKEDMALSSIASFHVDTLTENTIKELIRMHESVIISSHDESTMCFHGRRGVGIDLSSVETVPRPDLEHFVKNHLETLVLSLLLKRPMCGYDVIKTIHRKYHTFLSQGTVYPLLYSLKDKDLVEVGKSRDSRAKIYHLTEEGRRTTERRIRNFKKAQKYLLESIEE